LLKLGIGVIDGVFHAIMEVEGKHVSLATFANQGECLAFMHGYGSSAAIANAAQQREKAGGVLTVGDIQLIVQNIAEDMRSNMEIAANGNAKET
jgi:hypothetical protein